MNNWPIFIINQLDHIISNQYPTNNDNIEYFKHWLAKHIQSYQYIMPMNHDSRFGSPITWGPHRNFQASRGRPNLQLWGPSNQIQSQEELGNFTFPTEIPSGKRCKRLRNYGKSTYAIDG